MRQSIFALAVRRLLDCNTVSNLAQLLVELDIDCALIQEPYTKRQGDQFVFPDITSDYQLFHCLTIDHAYGV